MQSRAEIVAWVAGNIIPHEGALRARLRRMAATSWEIDDIVQDAYLNIARLKSVAHIRDGRAYLFTTARMAMLQRIRRDRIVRIDSLTEMQAMALEDEDPGPERRAGARRELERIRQLIDALPARCREIFELRRIEGVPQREIAARLGIAEHSVEQQATRGLKLILKALAADGGTETPHSGTRDEKNGGQSWQWMRTARRAGPSVVMPARLPPTTRPNSTCGLPLTSATKAPCYVPRRRWSISIAGARWRASRSIRKRSHATSRSPRHAQPAQAGRRRRADRRCHCRDRRGLLWPAGESFTTTIGEVRRLSLTDGSVATINTASRLTVTMAKTARRITLDDGEAWFEVAHDKARPFLVSAGDVHVRAVGTAFSVRRHTDGVDILVTEGVVETWTGDRSTAPTRLSGGERAFVADATTRIVAVPAGAEIERALSWRSGDLALNGEPLDYAVTELNRYNRRKLIVDDPVLGRTPIVGYFKVDDPDKFMRSVAVLLDARITTSGGDIHIAPKGS